MSFWQAELACASGVVLSILIPVLAKTVRSDFPSPPDKRLHGFTPLGLFALLRPLWPALRPYAILAVFSLAVSLLIVTLLGDKLATWRVALIAGYLWDSTLQKITGKP